MILLRSLIYNVLFFGSLGVFSICLFVFLPLPRRRVQALIRGWLRLAIWLLKVVAGIDYEVRGRENFPSGPALIAAKHQSTWDTGAFYLLTPDPAYVLKRELSWIPFYGWALTRVQMISVDRSAGAGALKSLVRQTRRALADRRHVVIFPEGTRMAAGETGTYQPGVAALDRSFDLPVVPVAVNSGLHWPRRSFLKTPGTIVIEFLEPMPKGLGRQEFMAELERRIETATDRLVEEGRREPSP